MATVAVGLHASAAGVKMSLSMVSVVSELRLPGERVRLEIHGVPTSRLQEGTTKLKRGPSSKGQVIDACVPAPPFLNAYRS